MTDEKLSKVFEDIEKDTKEDFDDRKKVLLKEKKEKEAASKNLDQILTGVLDRRKQAEAILEVQPMYYDNARNWWIWVWKKYKWKRIDETDILNSVNQHSSLNTISSKDKTEILEALKQVARSNKPQEVPSTWIQFHNQIYDVMSGERKDASPSYFVTNPIPWEVNIDDFSETPNIDKLFKEWVGEENVQTLYEIMAYCLLPSYPLHRIFCLIGSGMNGKSCFLALLRDFLGWENCASTELDTLMNSRFEVTRLHKKLVCLMGETNFNEMSKTSMLKKLSGGDLIGFEYKNKDLFEEKNYAKLIIATNNLPTTTDKTIGFYRRWMIIDFPNQFSETKDVLLDIKDEEFGKLALKCSLILTDLLKNRKFTNEGSIEDRMEKYESKSNFLKSFVEEFTEENDNSYITVNDFYKKFVDWCKTNRHREMFEKAVSIGLKKLGWEGEKRHFAWLFDGKGGQARVWEGRKWKD